MKYSSLLLLLLVFIFSECEKKESDPLEEEIRAIENGLLLRRYVKEEKIDKFTLEERMKYHMVPGLSIAVIKDGELRWAKGYGIANTETGQKVNTQTLFQAGSISKPIAALAVLKLVEEGVLDLDEDVNKFLKDWEVPENDYTKTEKVTLRRLLTHSAGITVHGFEGYSRGERFPTIDEVLNGKGNSPIVTVNNTPGYKYSYSGGGYTIIEKLVEDVTGLPFERVMKEYVLDPMEMNDSTYEQPLPSRFRNQASAAYNWEGKLIEGLWHNYPEQAAAGLWTTPSDLAKYCKEIQDVLVGAQPKVVSKETIEMMLTKHKNSYGLGPELHSKGDSLVFAHDGKNKGFTNVFGAFAHLGNGVIIMTNADNGGRLIDEILRSISLYYHWDIASQEAVEVSNLPIEYLHKFVGDYKYVEQVSEIGDYVMQILLEDEHLILKDTIDKRIYRQTFALYPLDSTEFIDLENGEKFMFQFDADDTSSVTGFLWGGDEQFIKL